MTANGTSNSATSQALLTFSGSILNIGDSSVTTADVALQVGYARSGNGASYVDLIGGTGQADYGMRMIRYGGDAGDGQVRYNGSGKMYLLTDASTDIVFSPNTVDSLTLKPDGKIGHGTASPTSFLHVVTSASYGSGNGVIMAESSSSAQTLIAIKNTSHVSAQVWELAGGGSANSTGAGFYIYDQTASAKRFNISTGGGIGVGMEGSNTAGRIDATNDIVAFSTSDRRLKENISLLENSLEKVVSLSGVEFDWIEGLKTYHGYEGHDVGVIAQEVKEVLPEAVRANESGYYSVRYEKVIPLLIEAIKDLSAKVDSQREEIESLKKIIF